MTDTYAHDLSAEDESVDLPEPEIDWKLRSEQMFSENVKQAERFKGKIRSQGEEIQELRRIIAALQADVKRMEPAHDKRIAAEKALDEAHSAWAAKYREQTNINRELRKQLDGGERAALESAIWYLNERARRLPPLPKEAMPAGDSVQ